MVRRAIRTLQALLLLPLVLLAGPADLTRFLCSMDGALRDRCCCPGDAEAADAPAPAELTAPACCTLDRFIAAEAPSEPPRPLLRGIDLVAWGQLPTAVAIAAPPPAPERPAVPERWVPTGPPLHVLKQAFLI